MPFINIRQIHSPYLYYEWPHKKLNWLEFNMLNVSFVFFAHYNAQTIHSLHCHLIKNTIRRQTKKRDWAHKMKADRPIHIPISDYNLYTRATCSLSLSFFYLMNTGTRIMRRMQKHFGFQVLSAEQLIKWCERIDFNRW